VCSVRPVASSRAGTNSWLKSWSRSRRRGWSASSPACTRSESQLTRPGCSNLQGLCPSPADDLADTSSSGPPLSVSAVRMALTNSAKCFVVFRRPVCERPAKNERRRPLLNSSWTPRPVIPLLQTFRRSVPWRSRFRCVRTTNPAASSARRI
jgi:hypothetical protein